MSRARCRTVTFFSLLWLAVLPTASAQSGLPIQPFEARFTVYRFGLPVADAFLTLAAEAGGRYSMRLDLRPNALTSWFSEQVEEWTLGELKDGIPRPSSYQRQRAGDEPSRVTLSFDWQGGRVQASKNNRDTSFALRPRLVDPLSWYLLVMSDLKKGLTSAEYSLIVGDSLKTYRVERHGEETVTTPFGELSTAVISRQREGSDTAVKLWHAPQLSFLPVQIAKIEQGEQTWRMTIQELKGIPLPGASAGGQ